MIIPSQIRQFGGVPCDGELTAAERSLLSRCPLLLGGDEALVLRVAGSEDAWVQDFSAGEVLSSHTVFSAVWGYCSPGRSG